jgi:bidirectional [NiFe] hydrogenase diaphorase subunit
MNNIEIHINGTPIKATANQTILEVCRQHGIEILTMCHLDGLSDVGRLQALPCRNRRQQQTDARLHHQSKRQYGHYHYQRTHTAVPKITTELLHAERNHTCAVCVANGHCELQDMTAKLEITHIRYPHLYPTAIWIPRTHGILWTTTAALCVRAA